MFNGKIYREDLDYDRIFFTGCTHFCHNNMLKFESWRGDVYKTEMDMTESLISEWNRNVGGDDLVIHLGDFGIEGKEDEMVEVVRQLNGDIILVKGNHDTDYFLDELRKINHVKVVEEIGFILKYSKMEVFLSHYPMLLDWSPRRVSVHSHIHGKEPIMNYMFNVGIDYTRKVVYSETELLQRVSEYKKHITPENRLKYYSKFELKESTVDKEEVNRYNIEDYDIGG